MHPNAGSITVGPAGGQPTARGPAGRAAKAKAKPLGPAEVESYDVEEEFRQLKDWMTQLYRCAAGYNKITGSLATLQGNKTGRQQGLPILEMPATVDGTDREKVVLDLKHLDPTYLSYVLVPLANMTAGQVLEALGEARLRFDRLHAHFLTVLSPAGLPPAELDPPPTNEQP